jgi:DNA-binding transcriptional ArsR family regulator
MTMIATFAALAEPNRLRIVELLRRGPQPVGEIGERLRLRQPQVSKHLRVLKDAGLVQVEALAQQRHYHLRPAPFRELKGWIEQYQKLWEERFQALDSVIEDIKRKEQKENRSHARKSK